ncbi:hypothetical protein EI77_00859 [Prosthecobacter fusiformis]|uniref:Uncharacterized protein n=1 Tax=Prosthecobacter fusiformis TaxID=48464 RepID=A0A4R7SSA4_9BACT|nr:hypothetical protein EI77_00859 [Prosthecobacter fusiformis]
MQKALSAMLERNNMLYMKTLGGFVLLLQAAVFTTTYRPLHDKLASS